MSEAWSSLASCLQPRWVVQAPAATAKVVSIPQGRFVLVVGVQFFRSMHFCQGMRLLCVSDSSIMKNPPKEPFHTSTRDAVKDLDFRENRCFPAKRKLDEMC